MEHIEGPLCSVSFPHGCFYSAVCCLPSTISPAFPFSLLKSVYFSVTFLPEKCQSALTSTPVPIHTHSLIFFMYWLHIFMDAMLCPRLSISYWYSQIFSHAHRAEWYSDVENLHGANYKTKLVKLLNGDRFFFSCACLCNVTEHLPSLPFIRTNNPRWKWYCVHCAVRVSGDSLPSPFHLLGMLIWDFRVRTVG